VNAYLMVAVIALCSAAIPLGVVWLVQRGKAERLLLQARTADAPLLARVKQIEARLAVLEALATDNRMQLAGEIDALRETA
jgi:hypothetical protein